MSTAKTTFGEITNRLNILVDSLSGGNVTAFAKKIGVSQATLHNYMKGRVPSTEALYNICNRCGVDLNWLVTGKGNLYLSESPAAVIGAGMVDEDPEIAELLEGARRVLKSGNPVAFDALERNIRYFDHAVAVEKRLEIVEGKLEELMKVLAERQAKKTRPDKAANE